MSYSRRQLYAMGEPLGDGATRHAVGGKVIYGSGGGGGNAEKQTTVVDLPEWAKPYAKESLGKASALTSSPYQVYGGERTAQFTPLQKQAFQSAGQQQVAGQIGQATGLAGLASARALNAGNYQTGDFDPMAVQGPQLMQYQMGPAMGVGSQSFTQPGEASRFMSPYMDAVVQRQMDSAQRQADIAGTQRGAQAVRAGAFGGSRQAIENAEAARALASQKGDIQTQGLQSAFQQAQQQFNQEQDASLRAQMANQGAGLTVGQQNLSALLGVQQLGAGQSMESQRANQQAMADAQRAFEQSRQFGADLGLRGGAQALQGAQTMGQLGQQQFGQEMDITGRQAQFGADQRQATQDILSTQYQDFLNQQRSPYDQLSFMSSIIRGTPMGQTTTMYQPPASPLSQFAGLGIAGAGAYGAYQGAAKAAGGEVKGYAAGGSTGITGLLNKVDSLSNDQLSQLQQTPQGPLTLATVAETLLNRQKMQEGAAQQQALMTPPPETTVVEDELKLAGLPGLPARNLEGMGEATMADGGIVAFQNRGEVPDPYSGSFEDLEPYRAGAYLRSGDKRIDPRTNQPITFGDFLRLQQAAKAAAAQPAAQKVIQQTLAPAAPITATPVVQPSVMRDATTRSPQGLPATPTTKETVDREPNAGSGGLPQLKGMQAATTEGLAGLKTQVEAINKARTDAAEEGVQRVKKGQEEDGVLGVEREKRLKAQEEGLKGAEGKNFNMALIEAGLAMMSGTSANAFENLGKGALVGTTAYTKGMDKIGAKREKLDEAVANLEDLRRADRKVSRKELSDAEERRDNAAIENANAIYTYGKDALGMTREDARFAVQTHLQQQQIAASNKKSFEERMVMALGKGDMAAGYKALKAMDAKPADLMGEYNDFLKANPTMAVGDQNAAMNAFMRTKLQLGILGSARAATPPAGASVAQFPSP